MASRDGKRFGVVAFCGDCGHAIALGGSVARRRIVGRAGCMALDSPELFLVASLPDLGACSVAVGMFGLEEWRERVISALGWDGIAAAPMR